jgi:hypothetical protein
MSNVAVKPDALAKVKVGVGDATTDTWNAAIAAVTQLEQTIGTMAAVNPNDLTVGRLIQQTAAIGKALEQYRAANMAQLQVASADIAAARAGATAGGSSGGSTSSASGVSAGATAFIAVGSAVVGGIAGYAVRGSMKRKK